RLPHACPTRRSSDLTNAGSDEASLSEQAGIEANEITYLEPQFFRTLYPPAAGFYPNGAVVNQITDRLLYQDPETLELSPVDCDRSEEHTSELQSRFD